MDEEVHSTVCDTHGFQQVYDYHKWMNSGHFHYSFNKFNLLNMNEQYETAFCFIYWMIFLPTTKWNCQKPLKQLYFRTNKNRSISFHSIYTDDIYYV